MAQSLSGKSSPEESAEKDLCVFELQEKFPFLSDYLTGLKDEEWITFRDVMANPMTKAEFFKLLIDLVKHVDLTSMQVVIPALLKMLGEMPRSFQSASQELPSVTYVEDETDIMVLKNEVLTEIIPKVKRKSKKSLCSSRKRSQSSLLSELGVSEDDIKCSVQDTLSKMLVIGSNTGHAEELINVIVQQIVVSIKVSLAEMKRTGTKSPRAAALRRKSSTEQLVQEVSRKLSEFASAQDPVCISERDVESSLASTAEEAMTAVTQGLKRGLDDQETKREWAKRCLARIKIAVPALTCQCACSTGVISDVEGEEEAKGVRRESQRSEQNIKSVSSEEFHSNAKKAVSDVLIGKIKTLHSAPRTPSSATPGAGSEASLLPPQPVEEAATILIETFVEEMKKVAQSAECADEPMSPDDHLPEVSGVKKKETVQLAAAKIHRKVQKTLKDFFNRLPLQQSQHCATTVTTLQHCATTLRTEDPQGSVSLAPGGQSAGDEQETELPASSRSGQALPVAEAQRSVDIGGVRSDTGCLLTPLQLEACTRNVLKGVVASYISGQEQKSPREQVASLELPGAKSCLLDRVILQLKDMACSSSNVCHEDDPSKLSGTDFTGGLSKPCSLTSLKRLSSVEFQMNAFESVTNVLVASVRSYCSLKSYASDIDKDEFRGVPWQHFFSKDVDAVVSEIVNQFVSDIQTDSSLASPSPDPSYMDACSPEAEPQARRSKLALSRKPFISSASKMYENLLSKVEKCFAQCSIGCNAPGRQPDDEHEMYSSLNTRDATQSNNYTEQLKEDTATANVTKKRSTTATTYILVDPSIHSFADGEHSDKFAQKDCSVSLTSINELIEEMMLDPYLHSLSDGERSVKSAEKDCSVSLASITELFEEFCRESDQMNAVKQGSQVLHHSAINLSRPSSSSRTEQTACQVAKICCKLSTTVSESTSSCDTKDNPSSEEEEDGDSVPSSQCTEQMREDLNIKIRTRICGMFSTPLRKVKDLFRTSQPLYSKTTCKSYAHAKEVISKALIRIRGSLLKSGDLDNLDNLSFVNEIIRNILVNIGEAEDHAVPEQTSTELERPASTSCKWSESSSNFPRAVTVTKEPAEGATERQKVFNSLTDDFVGEIYGLFRGSNRTTARKSASDSVLLELGHCSASKRRLVSQLIHVYSEETVKHYLLPHFNLPSSQNVSQGGLLRPASAPVRCPGNSSSSETAVDAQATTEGPRPPSKVLCDIMGLVIKSMVKDVMSSLSLALQSGQNMEDCLGQSLIPAHENMEDCLGRSLITAHENLEDRLGQPITPDHENLLSTQSSAASPQEASPLSSDRYEDASPDYFPKIMPVDLDTYAGLVTLLVVRLMMKIEGQGLQSEEMLDKSRQLIDNILYVFDIVSGRSRTDPFLRGTRIHGLFRTVYGDLLGAFDTEEALSKAMETDDASFEKTLVTSITKQLLRICEEDLMADSSGPVKNKKWRKRILRFIPRIPTLKIFQKKSKSANMEDFQDSREDQTKSTVSADTLSGSPTPSQQGAEGCKSIKCPSLLRRFSAIIRRKPALSD